MIAGETEMLLADHIDDDVYDDFLFFGNKEKRAKRRAARKARRAKRRAKRRSDRIHRKQNREGFLSKLGDVYKDLGGGAAIGGAIDTIISKPVPTPIQDTYPEQMMNTPSDFRVDIGDQKVYGGDNKSTIAVPQKKDNTNTILIIGGVVVMASIVGLAIYQSQKDKYVHIKQN
jgi:hypothetical protein